MFDRVALCYLMLSVLKNILPILCMNLSYLSIYASIYISIYLQYLFSYLSIIYILFFLFIHPSSIQKPLVNGILPISQAGAMFVGLRPGTWRRSPGEGLWRVALAVAQHSWGIGRRKNGDLARKPWGFIGNYGDLCFFVFFVDFTHLYNHQQMGLTWLNHHVHGKIIFGYSGFCQWKIRVWWIISIHNYVIRVCMFSTSTKSWRVMGSET